MALLRTLIVLKSYHHHNTAAVAEAMGKVLGADIADVEEMSAERLDEYDLVGFGSGIYFGMFHPALRTWVKGLPDSALRRPAFLFSTSGLPFLGRLWHWPFRRTLRKKGFETVGEFRCRGYDTVGPLWLIGGINRGHPSRKDLLRAEGFARGLVERLGRGD